jgi:transglutaminase-like putative cysteine protease
VNLTGAAVNPSTAQLLPVAGGIPGVKQTLKLMVALVRQYKTDLNVRTLAVQIAKTCEPKDKSCIITALQHYVRDDVHYVNDIDGVETIQTPVQTLKIGAGDCDDKATLLCALAAAVGFPTRFCAIGVRGGNFSHVMAQAFLGNAWINLETIIPDAEPGWFPEDASCVMLAHN